MKRFKLVSLKTVLLGRKGKTVLQTPLSVTSNAEHSRTTSSTSQAKTSSPPGVPEGEVVAEHEVAVFSSGAQHSGAYRTNLSSVFNWEKVRVNLLKAMAEEPMPKNSLCSVCEEQEP